MLFMELDEGMQFGTVWEVRGCTRHWHVLRPVRTPHGCGDGRHVVWQTLAWFASICEELMLCMELDEGMQFGTVWRSEVVPRLCMFFDPFVLRMVVGMRGMWCGKHWHGLHHLRGAAALYGTG